MAKSKLRIDYLTNSEGKEKIEIAKKIKAAEKEKQSESK